MASSKDYLTFVLEQLSDLDSMTSLQLSILLYIHIY